MSTQPFPPSSGAPAPAPGGAGGKRNPVLLVLGAILAVAGIVVGLVLIGRASSTVGDNVEQLGRAPAGCSTVLDFSETGTFLVFYEHKGTLPDLPGGCGGGGDTFDRGAGDAPRQTLSLRDANDDEVTIDDASGTSYRASGFAGEEIGTVKIDDAGRYTLSVSPRDAADAAVHDRDRQGPDPRRVGAEGRRPRCAHRRRGARRAADRARAAPTPAPGRGRPGRPDRPLDADEHRPGDADVAAGGAGSTTVAAPPAGAAHRTATVGLRPAAGTAGRWSGAAAKPVRPAAPARAVTPSPPGRQRIRGGAAR